MSKWNKETCHQYAVDTILTRSKYYKPEDKGDISKPKHLSVRESFGVFLADYKTAKDK